MIRIVVGAVFIVAVFGHTRMAVAEDQPQRLFQYADARIVESSGLAVSAVHRDIVYTHNDSDDAGRIFAVGMDGQTRAVITLSGVEARDWESIAIGEDDDSRPAVFVGDIGDNLLGAWPEVWVYRFPEPATLADAMVEPTRFRFRYEDGPRNAEALLVDPRDNRIYVVSKENGGGAVYRASADLSVDDANVLERVADAPALVTDGAFAPDGQRFVLRDYLMARIYDRPGSEVDSMVLPIAAQGEAVAYTRDGGSLLTGSEGAGSSVWQVPLPGADESAEGRDGTVAGEDDEFEAPVVWGNLAGLAAAVAAFFGLYQALGQRRQKAKKRKK